MAKISSLLEKVQWAVKKNVYYLSVGYNILWISVVWLTYDIIRNRRTISKSISFKVRNETRGLNLLVLLKIVLQFLARAIRQKREKKHKKEGKRSKCPYLQMRGSSSGCDSEGFTRKRSDLINTSSKGVGHQINIQRLGNSCPEKQLHNLSSLLRIHRA